MFAEKVRWASLLALIGVFPAGCDGSDATVPNRWYTKEQVQRGRSVFQTNCATCHGAEAQGLTENWKTRTADGAFPPPPLNGTGHAWHHPLSLLVRSVNEGGIPLGGKMPGFKEKLDDEDILAAIAYFQSYWPREIYMRWQQMGGVDG